MLFWTATDLENKLLDFRAYFNSHRTMPHWRLERLSQPRQRVPSPTSNLIDGNPIVEASTRHRMLPDS